MPKAIVIDTCIATAAGGKGATKPVPYRCREFMNEFFRHDFVLVMDKQMESEWARHESKFSKLWRSALNKRGRLKVDDFKDKKLRESITKLECRNLDKKAMIEDIHLVEAAFKHDRLVISQDGEVKGFYIRHKGDIPIFAAIAWLNPTAHQDGLVAWLKAGANPKKTRLPIIEDSINAIYGD